MKSAFPESPAERYVRQTMSEWRPPPTRGERRLVERARRMGWEFVTGFLRRGEVARRRWGGDNFLVWGRLMLAVEQVDSKEGQRLFRLDLDVLPDEGAAAREVLEQAAALARIHGRLAGPFLEAWGAVSPAARPDWCRLARRLAEGGWVAAEAYLSETLCFLEHQGVDLAGWGAAGLSLGGARLTAEFFRATAGLWPVMEPGNAVEWLKLTQDLAGADTGLAEEFLAAGSELAGRFPWDRVRAWAAEALRICAAAGAASARVYLAHGQQVMTGLAGAGLRRWVDNGTRRPDSGAYFALACDDARAGLRRLGSGAAIDDVEARLCTLGEAIGGDRVIIRSLEDLPMELSRGCASLGDGLRIYLPSYINERETREANCDVYREYFLHELAHLLEGTHAAFRPDAPGSSPYARALAAAQEPVAFLWRFHELEDQRVEQAMVEKLPGFGGHWTQAAASASWAESLEIAAAPGKVPPAGRAMGGLSAQLSSMAAGNALPARPTRLEQELWQRLEEFRQAEAAGEYRSVVWYPEWDNTRGDYLPSWCQVGEGLVTSGGTATAKTILRAEPGLVASLQRAFSYFRPERLPRYFAQPEGAELDLDAVVRELAFQRGHLVGDGLYIRREKHERDVAVALLLDLSASTENPLPSGRSILSVEIEAALIMAKCLEELGDRYAVYGFDSDERTRVNFRVVKDFGEPWDSAAEARLGNLQAGGATRLGAAMRHATRKLCSQAAALRLLLILSDGRPWDFDYHHQGPGVRRDDYPEADCRMALQEARRLGVAGFCITVDDRGYRYLPDIFGPVGFRVVQAADQLGEVLPVVYRQLTC